MRYIFTLFFCLVHFIACCQQVDFWQWNTLSIDKKITDKASVTFDEEVRLFHNATQLNLLYTNAGLSYKISKVFKAAFVYRLIEKRQDDNSFSFRHRLYFDLSAKGKLQPFVFTYRARIQSQVRDVNSSDLGRTPETFLRNKLDIKLVLIKKFTPFVALEFRYQFRNYRLREGNYTIDRGRYYVGFEYELSKKLSVGSYYMLQWEYNIKDPERDYVFGTTISLSL